MNKLIIANIKMNKNSKEMSDYLQVLNEGEYSTKLVVLSPIPFLFLNKVYNKISYGVQNFFYKDEGAFTGEVSLNMLKYLNVEYALIGHSERRKLFKESGTLINKKLLKCLEDGITPILCFGESLGQTKSANLTKAHFKRQITSALKGVKIADLEKIIIAYEPTYAVNGNEAADIVKVEENIKLIRELISAKSAKTEINVKVVYGGSINVENYKVYLNSEEIDGLLIGRTSLDAESLKEILE